MKWTTTSFGNHYSNPTLFLHDLLCLQPLAELPMWKVGAQICLKGHCWFQGESRLLASLTSPYTPKLACLFASLVRKSLDLRKRAVECGENTPMAACDHDAGRPCTSFKSPAADLPLLAVLSGKNVTLQFGGQDYFGHLTDSRSSHVPFGLGAARQLDPFQHIKWALQQVHPHAALKAVLEPKLEAVAKLVALKNPAELDKIRAGRLKFWTQRAKQLQKDRRSWLQSAPETLEKTVACWYPWPPSV